MGYTDGLVEKFGTDITVKSAVSPAGRAARAIISPLDFPDYDAVSRPARPVLGLALVVALAGCAATATRPTSVKKMASSTCTSAFMPAMLPRPAGRRNADAAPAGQAQPKAAASRARA